MDSRLRPYFADPQLHGQLLDDLVASTLSLCVFSSTSNRRSASLFCGVPCRLQQRLCWITAGHIVRELKRLQDLRSADRRSFWCPGVGNGKIKDTEIPADLDAFEFIGIDTDGFDVGIAAIRRFPAGEVLATLMPGLRIYDFDMASEFLETSDGYLLVGSPQQFWTDPRDADRGELCIRTGIFAARPVRPPFDGVVPEFAANVEALYGELMNFDRLSPTIETLKGASGGPLFGVTRVNQTAQITLLGIQSAWIPERRLIRATSLRQIREVLHKAITLGAY